MLLRRMLIQPISSRLDGDRLELRRGITRGNGSVVYLDNRRQIRGRGVANLLKLRVGRRRACHGCDRLHIPARTFAPQATAAEKNKSPKVGWKAPVSVSPILKRGLIWDWPAQ